MQNTAFTNCVSIDSVPDGKRCEGLNCRHLAEHHYTALGGKYHNSAGFFCSICGATFVHTVEDDASTSIFSKKYASLYTKEETMQGNQHSNEAQNPTHDTIIVCTLCHQKIASGTQKKVSGYMLRGRVDMCCDCAEIFLEYVEEFVHPKYPVA